MVCGYLIWRNSLHNLPKIISPKGTTYVVGSVCMWWFIINLFVVNSGILPAKT